MLKTLILISVLFAPLLTQALPPKVDRTAIVFGGNCDEGFPKKEADGSFSADSGGYHKENNFLPEMINLSGQLKKHDWKTKVLYDSTFARCALASTEVVCQSAQPPKECCEKGIVPELWSTKNYVAAGFKANDIGFGSKQALIDSLKKTIEEISNDKRKIKHQVLLVIDTHGQAGDDHEAHGICLSDGTYLPMNDPSLLPVLQNLKAAADGGLAILDDSCFGGGTITALEPILGKNTCLLSSQSANTLSHFTVGLNDLITKNLAHEIPLNGSSLYQKALEGNLKTKELLLLRQPEISGFATTNHFADIIQAESLKGKIEELPVCQADRTGIHALLPFLDQLKEIAPLNGCLSDKTLLTQLVEQFDQLVQQETDINKSLNQTAIRFQLNFNQSRELERAIPILKKAFSENLKTDPNLFGVLDEGFYGSLKWEDLLDPNQESIHNIASLIAIAINHQDPDLKPEKTDSKIVELENRATQEIISKFQGQDLSNYLVARTKIEDRKKIRAQEDEIQKKVDDEKLKLNHCFSQVRLRELKQNANSEAIKACNGFKFN